MDPRTQPSLRPSEFACLQYERIALYTEIIQVIEPRQRYWARPVLLCESVPHLDGNLQAIPTVYDVRSCSDLLWPRSLFRCVYDTELIPLLATLDPPTTELEGATRQSSGHLEAARQKLHQFTQQLWRAYPTAFLE
jgi:hypothetical protein